MERRWLDDFESEPSNNMNTQKNLKNANNSSDQYFSEFASSK